MEVLGKTMRFKFNYHTKKESEWYVLHVKHIVFQEGKKKEIFIDSDPLQGIFYDLDKPLKDLDKLDEILKEGAGDLILYMVAMAEYDPEMNYGLVDEKYKRWFRIFCDVGLIELKENVITEEEYEPKMTEFTLG
jgi:hypothetical protein